MKVRLRTTKQAGLLRRLAAGFYDLLLLASVLFLATALALPITHGKAVEPGNTLFNLYLLTVSFGYYGYFWCHGGQTLGLRAWKVKVIGINGQPVGRHQAFIRFIIGTVSFLAFGLGFVWSLYDKNGLTWHDRASKTLVVRI